MHQGNEYGLTALGELIFVKLIYGYLVGSFEFLVRRLGCVGENQRCLPSILLLVEAREMRGMHGLVLGKFSLWRLLPGNSVLFGADGYRKLKGLFPRQE